MPIDPPLADIGQTIGVVFGALSLYLALVAIVLAARHSRDISKVQDVIEAAEEQTRSNLKETTKVGTQTLEALKLHEILLHRQDLSKSLLDLAEDFAQVTDLNDDLITKRAHQDVTQARSYLHTAAEGYLSIGPEALAADEEIPIALLKVTEAGDHFWASSAVSPRFFWARAAAYLQLQSERVDAGVRINRVFIFNTRADYEEEQAQRQMRLQAEKGIHVHYVIEPKYTPLDLVAVARPTEKGKQDDVRYAAEFTIADGRVTNIELWADRAGHKGRIERVWNSLNMFYSDAEKYQP